MNRTHEPALSQAPASRVSDFVALLKPRVMTLVVFSGAVGLFVAPGALHPLLAVVAILCIAVGSGAAGAINMWYDRDIDAVMARTSDRPLPAGRVAPGDALGFAIVLAAASVVLMAFATNVVAAGLLALAILFYVFVYTVWLKRRTPQNIVIGGAAGAFPPMIGWAAVTGDVSLVSLSLFAVIFLWTPPHFWALALYRSGDYARAGIPMMPVVAGRATTKRQMLAYTLILVPVSLTPALLGGAGLVYAAGAAVLGLMFIASAIRVLREPEGAEDRAAKAMFGFSILYLFLLFAVLLADVLLGFGSFGLWG
ncbi:MAG: heme o synthase [Alphaproteobacteria bacterium]